MALEPFPAPAPLRGQAWAIRCDRVCLAAAAAAVFQHTGRGFSECSVSVELIGQSRSPAAPGHSCACWRKGALSVQIQSWASFAVSLLPLLPFLPSPECDRSSTVKLPHSQPAVSPSPAGVCYWVNGLFPEIHQYLGAHIILMCRKLS